MPRLALHCACVYFVALSLSGCNRNHSDNKQNQTEIIKMLKQLDHESMTLIGNTVKTAGFGSEILGTTSKPEKNEFSDGDDSKVTNADTIDPSFPADRGTPGITTAIESGQPYLTGKPIKSNTTEDRASFLYYPITPEDDNWLKKKVKQMKGFL